MEETNEGRLNSKKQQIAEDIKKIVAGIPEDKMDDVLKALEERKCPTAEPEKVDSVRPMTSEEMVEFRKRLEQTVDFIQGLGINLVVITGADLVAVIIVALCGALNFDNFLRVQVGMGSYFMFAHVPIKLLVRYIKDIIGEKKKQSKNNPEKKEENGKALS